MSMIERYALRGGGSVQVSVMQESDPPDGLSKVGSDGSGSIYRLRDGTRLDQLHDGRLEDPRNGERYVLLPATGTA